MDEKTIGIYMTKEEYASTHEGVVKNAEHADSATGSSFADNAVKLGGKEATYYASADSVTTLGGTVNEVLATANGALSVAVAAQGTANAAMSKADIVQEAGTGTDKVMSQKAVTDALAEGRILTVNGQGPDTDGNVEIRSKLVRVGISTNQPTQSGAEVKVNFDQLNENDFTADILSDGGINTPEGFAFADIAAGVTYYESTDAGKVSLRLYVGEDGKEMMDKPLAANASTTQITGRHRVTAGDRITLRATQTSGGTLNIYKHISTYMTVVFHN